MLRFVLISFSVFLWGTTLLAMELAPQLSSPELQKLIDQGTVKRTCDESYVPPHDPEQLQDVVHWASVAAFARYAGAAGFRFDRKSYYQDTPNRALFNFGLATATNCLNVDVAMEYVSLENHLGTVHRRYQQPNYASSAKYQSFTEIFVYLAESFGADQYLIPLEDEP